MYKVLHGPRRLRLFPSTFLSSTNSFDCSSCPRANDFVRSCWSFCQVNGQVNETSCDTRGSRLKAVTGITHLVRAHAQPSIMLIPCTRSLASPIHACLPPHGPLFKSFANSNCTYCSHSNKTALYSWDVYRAWESRKLMQLLLFAGTQRPRFPSIELEPPSEPSGKMKSGVSLSPN